ncbi:hypothetical protein UNPF46_28265 [Bradyrhizobium sp. UNPF46]|uniref:hypothetical protein n=1 Tax=Bradyrhizobium sp. UNPF46 TaxID=1141168 RepID=UPI00115074D0|nr:hypothetical protein [Bradyrhizobium sp. UNPF46]TQF28063.1 hypothetical protein UNPF46_28265 [Bradyrhizobium sp. UNPF46]
MLRMALLGLLILLSVGVLSAMELNTPARRAVAIAPPLADQSADVSVPHDALAKADSLEIAAVGVAMPTQPASVESPAAPQDVRVVSPAPAPVVRQRSKAKPIAIAKPHEPKPKALVVKRTANVPRAKAASETESCRLKAFGGLLKAWNLNGCEI